MAPDRFDMWFCDDVVCRVNTFEYGTDGVCPGCDEVGEPIPQPRAAEW